MEIFTIAGYDEEELSLSLKRKHFVLLGNTQQVVAGALSEQGKYPSVSSHDSHCGHMILR